MFQKEYNELRDDISEYVVRLLDRVRNQQELEIVLNKRGPSHLEKYSKLARLKLALRGDQRKVCQCACVQAIYNIFSKCSTLQNAYNPLELLIYSVSPASVVLLSSMCISFKFIYSWAVYKYLP